MQNARSWMPVFVVLEPAQEVVAVHAQGKGCPVPQATRRTQEYAQRVGAAFLKKNGDIEVQLFALPLSGRFVLRAPTPEDRWDPTTCAE